MHKSLHYINQLLLASTYVHSIRFVGMISDYRITSVSYPDDIDVSRNGNVVLDRRKT